MRRTGLVALAAALLLGLAVAALPVWLAALLLAGAAALLLMLGEPLLGLALALLAGPFGAFENRVWGNQLLDSGQLFFFLVVVVWLSQGAAQRAIRLPLARLHLPLAAFLGVAALSLLDAPSLTFGLRELVKWLEIGLLLLMAVDLAATSPRLQWLPAFWQTRVLVGMLLLAGMSQAVGGIWQAVIRGSGPEFFHVAGRFYRPYGTFDQPNPFGGYVGLNACLALGTLAGLVTAHWQARRWGTWAERWWLLFVAGAAVTTTAALVLSWSRGAWLGFVAGMATLLFFWPRRRMWGMAALMGGLVLFVVGVGVGVVPASITQRLTSFTAEFTLGDVRGVDINDANYAVLERLAHWQSALDMARDQLWSGVGFGNYEPAYPAYALINWPYALGHAHNYYLNLLAEVGLAGIIAYLIFWAAVIWQAVHLLPRLPLAERGIALGLLAAWAALTVHHLVDKLYVNNVYLHLGVMLALQQLLARHVQDRGERVKTPLFAAPITP
ncbi:MAG: hypothetical protein Fur0021_34620 [Candidatus Promineifilaceae bacterium]